MGLSTRQACCGLRQSWLLCLSIKSAIMLEKVNSRQHLGSTYARQTMSCIGIGENVSPTVRAQLSISWDASGAADRVLGPTTCTHGAKCCNGLWKGDSEGRHHHIWRMLFPRKGTKWNIVVGFFDDLAPTTYSYRDRSKKMVLPASFEFQLNQYGKLANYFLHLRLTNFPVQPLPFIILPFGFKESYSVGRPLSRAYEHVQPKVFCRSLDNSWSFVLRATRILTPINFLS